MQRKPPGAGGKAAKPTTGGYHGALRAGLAESEEHKKMLPECSPAAKGKQRNLWKRGVRSVWGFLIPGHSIQNGALHDLLSACAWGSSTGRLSTVQAELANHAVKIAGQ
jgi:hypothetical protein